MPQQAGKLQSAENVATKVSEAKLKSNAASRLFNYFCSFFGICGTFVGFWGHPEIGTAITKCFEHLDDEKHILDPGQLYP